MADQTTDGFYTNLSCGALGIRPGFEAAVDLAIEFGFGAVEPDVGYLTSQSAEQVEALRSRLAEHGVKWGNAGLPVDLNADAATFASQLAALNDHAARLASYGIDRVGTWIRPMSNSLTYRRNFRRHAERIALVDEILAGAGVRFGLEYVGPKSFWSTELYPFVHTLAEARELIDAVGSPNVGLILDTFHWYTSGESAADIAELSAEEVVAVDLNDAPTGLERDQQQDGQRMLPGATGVIDVAGFVGALRKIGYVGPVKVEPFNAELRAMDPRDAVAKTAESLNAVL
ncbi:sugar phosphate isomerase/epimerase family protein [Actinopolymorpha singaporensis]|uniref:Sugar phosphate isomerase/epimerase n=1 Tax=Actinopolymorpha singaporensis TaxID=117157 RepID=A0A1H1Y8K0_9ACTN|nr:sugar phosphate isomerase/epimerase family protein [Actinopolymorpha singaporensis]SDT17731.1 Sugar phosphate isomerase/epimerase [Actinopolymorpha singaporensis]